MEPKPEIKAAIEHVNAGDPIDNDVVLRHTPVRGASLAAAFGLGVPIGLNGAGGFDNYEFLAANGIYLPAAAAAAAVGNYAIRKFRTRGDEKAQEDVDEAIGEPVDLLKLENGKDRWLALRWYGLDDETESANVVGRSERVLQFAHQYGIDGVIVNKAPFATLHGVDALNTYSAWGVLGEIKDLPFAQLYDSETPAEEVLYATLEEFADLVNEYKVDQRVSAIEAIVKNLKNPFLGSLYKKYSDSQSPAVLARMQSYLKQEIETAISESHLAVNRQPDGSRQHQKMHAVNAVMSGGRTMNMQVGLDALSGNQQLDFAGINELGKTAGLQSNQQLLERISDGDLQQLTKLQLQSGLYLLLSQADGRLVSHDVHGEEASATSTFVPFLARISKADIHERSSAIQIKRLSLRGFALAAAVAAGYSTGVYVVQSSNAAYEQNRAAFEEYAEAHGGDPDEDRYDIVDNKLVDGELYKAYLEDDEYSDMKFMRFYSEAVGKAYEVDDAAQYAVAKVLLKTLDIEALAKVFPSYEQAEQSRLAEKLAIDAPPDIYTRSDYNLGIGDVASDSNKVVYTIKSLTGAPTDGYWYEQSYGEILLEDDDRPRHSTIDMSVAGPSVEVASLPTSYEAIIANKPDYMVETPYIGIMDDTNIRGVGEQISMPVRFGGLVVGARIVDKQDESKEYYPQVATNGRGSYEIDSNELNFGRSQHLAGSELVSPILASDMQEPVLQYFVRNNVNPAFAKTSQRPMVRFSDARPGFIPPSEQYRSLLPDAAEIAQSIRQELGLKPNASAREVLRAISEGKLYAYEPLKYDDVELSVPEQGPKQTATSLGRILAELDTANCNVATLTMLLANIDRNELQAASGFRNDGDEFLTQQEAHAWNISADGKIVDPTPRKMAPDVKERDGIDENKEDGGLAWERGAAALLGGAIVVLTYRRRRQIGRIADALRTKVVFAHPAMAATVDRLSHELYGRPTATYTVPVSGTDVQDPAEVFSRRVPKGTKISMIDKPPAERFKRGIIRLNQAAIRRHVALKSD